MKFIKILLIFFVLNSCVKQEKVEVDIPIYRFDKNFSKINDENYDKQLAQIESKFPGFTDYYNQRIEDNQNWYEPREIYANVTISDNVPAYYSLAGDNINTLNTMMGQQPVLDGGIL